MMITLLTVGKTDVKWVKEGLDLYGGRLRRYAAGFAVREIPGLRSAAGLTREQVKEREGALILKGLKPSDEVLLLDERGEELRSAEFAKMLGDRLLRGRDLVFVTGGAYGFGADVYARADGMLSLSKMTFPHQLVRTIFAEQLYRAFTILRHEPYHHE